ncbi:MAG: amino acid permease [Chitinophagales bacterium]
MKSSSTGPSLKLLDAILIVSGSMIGSGIFIVSADMARTVGSAGWLLLLWLISGLMTVFAALSYGELAGMFPKAGGQYVYLKEAYNPLIGFLYGWSLFLIVQSGTIAAVGVAFAKFAGVLYEPFSENNILLNWGGFQLSAAQLVGIFSILVLTVINSRGIQYGKWIVRIFSSAKIFALFGIIILGILFFGNESTWQQNMQRVWEAHPLQQSGTSWIAFSPTPFVFATLVGAALVGSLFSSDAWNNVTFISGDIENPKRNIPLSLVIGTSIVTVLYFLANVAYLKLLPFYGDAQAGTITNQGIQFAAHDRVGTAAATMIFGAPATMIMAVLIMISTFSCNNGIILSSVRVYQAMAVDGLFFEKMKFNNRFGVPGFALWIQFIWSALLCLSGRYNDLLDYVMFAVMLFYIFTIYGIFILRKTQPETFRPYRAFGFPLVPAIYILMAGAFCVNLIYTKPWHALPGLVLVIAGIPVYLYWRRKNSLN